MKLESSSRDRLQMLVSFLKTIVFFLKEIGSF